MQDRKKTKDQKTTEVVKLRQRIAEFEASETERKGALETLQSEYEQLKVSETLYRTLVDNMDIGISLIDADYTIVMANAAEVKYSNKSINDVIGEKCFREFKKRETVCPNCPGFQAMATSQSAEVEIEEVGDNGNCFNARVQVFPVLRDDGTVTGFIKITEIITERKRLEEQLRKSEQAFRSLFEATPVGSGLLVNRKIVKVNPALCRMTGYSADELEGQSARIAYRDDEEFERVGKILYEQVARDGIGITEAHLRFKSGAEIEALMHLSPLDPQDPSAGFVASGIDITERKLAEEALRESAEKFRIISNTTMDSFSEVDQDGHFLYVNEESCRMHGYSRDEYLTMSISDMEAVETANKTKRHLKNVIETGSDRFESRIRNKDGRLIDIEASISFFPLTGHFLNFHRDITERKQAEELMRLQHELAVALSAEHDLNEGLRLCVDAAMRISGMDCGGIYLVDEISGDFNLVIHEGLSLDFVRSVSHYEADSDNARLMMAGKPAYKKDLNSVAPLNDFARRENLLALAAIPIHSKNQVIGCLNIASHTVIELSSSACSALESIAAQSGSAIARLRSEEAFRRSKARFGGLVDLLPQTVFEIDERGKFLFVNAFGFEASGYTQEDIDKGLNALQLFIPRDREKVQENIRRILNGEKLHGNEYTALRKDGTTFPVILYSNPIIHEGKPVGVRGIAIDITVRKQLIEERLHNFEKLRRSLEETIGALVSTLEARDPYTAGHQKRVADLAVAIAEEIGLPNDQIDGIRMAGLVHDIGKIYVPSDLLNKTNRLNRNEYELFKSHCQVGYDILKKIDFPWLVAPMVLQHHERQDGSGYPQGLYGKDIILEARILAVADVVEAMSGHRPYRPAYSIGDALEEILHYKDSLYDPDVVDACLRVFYNKGFKFKEEKTEM